MLVLVMDFVCAFDDSIGGIGDNINLSLTVGLIVRFKAELTVVC